MNSETTMNKRFFIAAGVTTVVNLLLHGLVYVLLLKDLYERYPAVAAEFTGQPPSLQGRLIPWGLAVSAIAFGCFITLLMKQAGARTFVSGLKAGSLLSFLFWCSVNFGLYASSHHFSIESLFADLACSTVVMSLACAVSAQMLGTETKESITIKP